MLTPHDHVWSLGSLDVLEKGGDKGLVRGILSSERRDLDGEVIIQKGMDVSEITELHLHHPLNAFNLVGEVLDTKPAEVKHDGTVYKATAFEGRLFVDELELAKKTWEQAASLSKASDRVRMKTSVEGYALKRDAKDPKTVLRSKMYSCAIDMKPRNRDTRLEAIMAGLSGVPVPLWRGLTLAGYPGQVPGTFNGLAALTPQSMDGGKPPSQASGPVTSGADAQVTAVLKKFPWLTWAQGQSAVQAMAQAVKAGGSATAALVKCLRDFGVD